MVSRESIGIIQDKALRFCSTLHHSCPFNEFIALWIELLALGMLSKYSNTNLHPLPITFRLRVLIWFLWSGHLEEIADKPILYNSPIVYYKHNQKISLNYFLSLHMFKLLIFFLVVNFILAPWRGKGLKGSVLQIRTAVEYPTWHLRQGSPPCWHGGWAWASRLPLLPPPLHQGAVEADSGQLSGKHV